jgi:uncharacterized delta-60 repeat protein
MKTPLFMHPGQRNEDIFLARYTSSGSLDPSFGEGGILRTDLGATPPPPWDPIPGVTHVESWPPLSQLGGLAVDPAGQIVLSASRATEMVRGCKTWFYMRRDAYVSRLLDDGSLDPSFGEGGVVVASPSYEEQAPAISGTGAVYLFDWLDEGCYSFSSRLTGFSADGQRDEGFGEGGILTLPSRGYSIRAIAVDRRGRILLLDPGYDEAHERSQARVRRLLSDGQFDPSFGRGGQAGVPAPAGFIFTPRALAAERSGGVVVVGTASSISAEVDSRRFMIGRLTPDGHLDRGFGRRGAALTRFGEQSKATATSLALVRGGILAAGTLSRPSLPGSEGLALARYTVR